MTHNAYERIVVPTDMSDFSALALRYAAAFRERLGSSLTLLYADELFLRAEMLEAPLGQFLENAPPSRERQQQRLRQYGEERIGGTFETLVVADTAVRAILQADLIVMGTHGRQGLRRAILGSVTENLLHHTDVPVLTVTPALMDTRKEIAIRRILCPVNFTRVARESLSHACAVAAAFDAEVHVMYVLEEIDSDRAPEVEMAFGQWVDPQLADRCRFTHSVVRNGDPAERVLAAAGAVAADMMVIGAQHKFFSDATVIGTTTQRITRFARVPVLTVTRKATAEVAPLPERELVDVM
ncbi:MAG TPA: universal stress protein [Thermoanaerobaculia bacterium]|nr:universal stress protein [Thermoanaerobaculia bacterium]